MFSEASETDDTIRRLQHEKNVWRGVAIGLIATLVLVFVLAGGSAFLLLTRSRAQAMRAEDAARQAVEAERQAKMQAEEARRAAEKQRKARP